MDCRSFACRNALRLDRLGRGQGKQAQGGRTSHVTGSSKSASVAAVADGGMSDAEKIRRLDIMLMVTGLRCRDTEDDFQGDFSQF